MENHDQDIRWIQRFQNYRKALAQLQNAVQQSEERVLSDLETQGLIQAFEFTHELAWNVMKDFAEYQGNTTVRGSRDATREGFKVELITDGEAWMDMIKSRNLASHTYNQATAQELAVDITTRYFPLFKQFEVKMEEIRSGEQHSLF
ncbi:MAG: nucleotidyltransferase substrate binding protein [Saprospiraceae bacterium]|nr:nucleotidyltransferase substrate binding protein [Saprospiraceae bacterium]